MLINKRELIENLKYNLISIIILMNAFQLVLNWSFNININMWIEYALIILLLIISKFKIRNLKNILVILICSVIFAINILLNDTEILRFYLNQFLIFALPLLIIFMIDIDLKSFTKIFFYYNVINILLYLLYVLVYSNGSIKDYMSFGYFAMFSLSYIIVYAYYNKYFKTMICALVTVPIIIINGNRGTILIVGTLIFLIMLMSNKTNKIKKIAIFVLLMIIISNINNIAKFSLDFVTQVFKIEDTYSIRNLYNMLDSRSTESLLGGRYYIYENTVKEIGDHPILGMGVAAFQNKYGYFPHNLFLDVYSTFGIILGTLYFIYLVIMSIKLYKLSVVDMQVRILFIFMFANLMKLILSKTFIYDSAIWLYIALGNLILVKYKKRMHNQSNKMQILVEDKRENNKDVKND